MSPETIQKYDELDVPWLVPPHGNAYRDVLLWERDDDLEINIYIQLYGFTPRQVSKYREHSLLSLTNDLGA